MFSCNLPPALLAEWPGSFTCYCGNTGVERIPKKSQHRKSTLENKILPPVLQGFEPATFQSRVRRSNHWAIPAPEVRHNPLAFQAAFPGTLFLHWRRKVVVGSAWDLAINILLIMLALVTVHWKNGFKKTHNCECSEGVTVFAGCCCCCCCCISSLDYCVRILLVFIVGAVFDAVSVSVFVANGRH